MKYDASLKAAMTDRAKELISQLLMVTSGVSEIPPNSEWGAEFLLELLEMFTIRDENLSFYDLAEDLQFHLFVHTQKHDSAYRDWKQEVLAENDGEQFATGEKSKEHSRDEIEANETYERFTYCQKIADENEVHQLFAALINHPQIDTGLQTRIFNFVAENSIVPVEDLQEISLVTGIEYKPEKARGCSKG